MVNPIPPSLFSPSLRNIDADQFSNVDGSDDFRRYFDFSKFPNLQEVELGVCVSWRGGGLPWIPMALSTLKPATSPHLSTIRFDFSCSPGVTRPVEASIREVGSDLQRIAEEVARIEREFEGTVNLTAFLDSVFKEVLDTLDVRFRFLMWTRPSIHLRSSLVDPSARSSRWDPELNLPLVSFGWSFRGVESFGHIYYRLAHLDAGFR